MRLWIAASLLSVASTDVPKDVKLVTIYPGTTTGSSYTNSITDSTIEIAPTSTMALISTAALALAPTATVDMGSVQDEDGESQGMQAKLPNNGDTSIIQNNYNLKMSTMQRLGKSDLFVYIAGSLMIVFLLLGIGILSAILFKLLGSKEESPPGRILIVPHNSEVQYAIDPVTGIPKSYDSGPNGKVEMQQSNFSENSLHPPTREE
jgi:hypothetical protein